MTRYSTLDDLSPPAAISFFTVPSVSISTNTHTTTSLLSERIHSTFEGAQRELSRYRGYAPRWDGYRAEPFAPEVLGSAAQILAFSRDMFLGTGTIPTVVTTGPASDGSIDVEIQVLDRRLLMTLYPHEEQLRLASFDHDVAHEHVEPLRNQTVEHWLNWLHHPRPVRPGMGQNLLRP